MIEFRVSIYKGSEGVCLTELNGKRTISMQGNPPVNTDRMNEALDILADALEDDNGRTE